MNIRSQGELPRSSTLKKVLVYGVILFILAVAQCSFFSSLRFLSATPNIVLGALAAMALFESQRTTTVFAVGAGFVIDAIGGTGLLISPLLMLLFSVIFCTLASKMLKSFFPWTLILALASLISALSTYLRLVISGNASNISLVFGRILLPELIYTFLFSLPLYFVFRIATKACESKGKFKI